MNETVLTLKNISKYYPGVIALDDVSLELRSGEVHALIGENGAGKSTLIKCVSGAIRPEKGEIYIGNEKIEAMTPIISRNNGISVIYQDPSVCPQMTIAENMFLGKEPRNGINLDYKEMYKKTKDLLDSLNLNLDPKTKVKELSAAYKQMLEIAKAISINSKILIMDEPTAAISSSEVKTLFKLVKKMRDEGICIVFITHRLDEVFELSDTITVLRDGHTVGTVKTEEIDRNKLISLMVGRELTEIYPHKNNEIGDVVLDLVSVTGNGDENVSFNVRRGEILGVGGLVGAGRSELAMMLMGMVKKRSGKIILNGEEIQINSPSDAIHFGIGLVAEDRRKHSVIIGLSIAWNITLASLRQLTWLGKINTKKEQDIVNYYKEAISIKTPDANNKVSTLSGGNQQKVAISKWLATGLKVLIFDEPTQGVDVGARSEIYKVINDLCAQGVAIIMISSDMEELLGMSDRIIVMAEGHVTGEIQKPDFSQELVLKTASI